MFEGIPVSNAIKRQQTLAIITTVALSIRAIRRMPALFLRCMRLCVVTTIRPPTIQTRHPLAGVVIIIFVLVLDTVHQILNTTAAVVAIFITKAIISILEHPPIRFSPVNPLLLFQLTR